MHNLLHWGDKLNWTPILCLGAAAVPFSAGRILTILFFMRRLRETVGDNVAENDDETLRKAKKLFSSQKPVVPLAVSNLYYLSGVAFIGMVVWGLVSTAYTSAMQSYEAALQVCANRAYAEVRHQHLGYFRIEQRGESRVLVVDKAYMEAVRQILATDFDYFNTVKNMVTCCTEMGDHNRAAELQDHANTCTPIDADIIGPIQPRK